jgi:hypothetical protein
MIGLKEITFVNETIKCLMYKTMKYMKKINMYTIIEFLIQYTHYLKNLHLKFRCKCHCN